MAAGECKADVTGKHMSHCSGAGGGLGCGQRHTVFQLCHFIGINKVIMCTN